MCRLNCSAFELPTESKSGERREWNRVRGGVTQQLKETTWLVAALVGHSQSSTLHKADTACVGCVGCYCTALHGATAATMQHIRNSTNQNNHGGRAMSLVKRCAVVSVYLVYFRLRRCTHRHWAVGVVRAVVSMCNDGLGLSTRVSMYKDRPHTHAPCPQV